MRPPVQIAAAPLRTVRPLMLRHVYANPEKELVRMRTNGQVVRIAPGTYTLKPDDLDPATPWRPMFEEAAMAYATAQYGNRVPILYGLGAARFHHAIPRAIGTTVIAVPQAHRPVTLTDGGRVVFTTTDVEQLDARLEQGKLGRFMVTTPEQTLVDLINRPRLGNLPTVAAAAVTELQPRIDRNRLASLMAKLPKAARIRVEEGLK